MVINTAAMVTPRLRCSVEAAKPRAMNRATPINSVPPSTRNDPGRFDAFIEW